MTTANNHEQEPQPAITNDAALHTIEATLEDTRRRLLDLTRRNRLLNHRTTGRTTLRIVDELPAEVFRLLVAEEQTLQFLAREEAPREAAGLVAAAAAQDEAAFTQPNHTPDAPLPETALSLAPIDAGTAVASRHGDTKLQTTLFGEQLHVRLLALAREAASAREEQGCNMLYLTLGMVEWRESTRDGVSRAPLLFIPADLQRRSVQSRHSLRLFEDDIIINPCLIELCRRVFRCELPLVEPDESLDVDTYFAAVAAALTALPGWKLVPDVHLGLFSFAKLLMYRDLDPATWPQQQQLATHAIVQRLSGFATAIPSDELDMPAPDMLDARVRPTDSFQVVDADSSQQVAILAARTGFNVVIEGPPGTGKSQTITNIIAECLAAGKSVLFVAEKAAALSVVKRRLVAANLGDFVLELHSNKTSKRIVLDELQRTLAAYAEPIAGGTADPSILETTRAQVNVYPHDLHTPLGELGISPYEAIQRALATRTAPEPACAIADPTAWTATQLSDTLGVLDDYDRWHARIGDPGAHPWRALTRTVYDTTTRQRIQQSLPALLDALTHLDTVVYDAACHLQIRLPDTLDAAEAVLVHARAILDLAALAPGMLSDTSWEAQSAALDAWIEAGSARMQRKAFWLQSLHPAAEKSDWTAILQRRREHNASLAHAAMPTSVEDRVMRWFSTSWNADAQQFDQQVLPGVTLTPEQQLEVLQALVDSAELRATTLAGVKQYAALFRSHWTHIDGDWDALRAVLHTVLHARELVASEVMSPLAAARFLEQGQRADLEACFTAVDQAVARTEAAWQAWFEAIESDEAQWLGGAWRTMPFDVLRARHAPLASAVAQLDDWIQFQRVRAACVNGPARSFVEWVDQPGGEVALGQLAHSFARQFYQLWLDHAFRQRPALGGFRGDDHAALIQRFCAADRRWIAHNRDRVAQRIRSRMPDLGRESHRQSKLGILKGEMRKKRRHMALRKLFTLAGDVLQTIKPCFMMSPISIAQYLAPGALAFDVVIFDEASQVEPADAYGAIARGRQLLLVGDEKQLPPTSFFTKIEGDDTPTEDDSVAAGDLESVLSLGVVRLKHQCALRWHYRSRHASLIDFSNQQFYDGKLRVFPGPYAGTDEYGLSFRFVAGGVYMRGAGQHNPVEARTVAEAALRHIRDTPNVSLGIGAFSVAQQRAIEDEVERLRRTSADPRIEAFFTAQTAEPFFVKNLETIQGDERDVILLSVGYGPDQHGKISMNFGPLNRDNGWRRLNVLVTRARQRCVLFSSMHADQLNLGTTKARGVAALKAYLHLAEHGDRVAAAAGATLDTSSLDDLVAPRLRAHGWDVHARVGTVGSFVDLAVIDPHRPGRYLLGIEGDGATYAQAPTARDRERLRQQVLEDLGWSIQRIWSVDWYHRPEAMLAHLLDRLAAMGAQSDAAVNNVAHTGTTTKLNVSMLPPDGVTETDDTTVTDVAIDQAKSARAAPTPYVQRYTASALRQAHPRINAASLGYVPSATWAEYITQLVADESPIHEDEAQRVLAAYCNTRVSKNLREVFAAGLHMAISNGVVDRRGAFLWHRDMQRPPLRLHGDDSPVTKPELIAPEELHEAITCVLTQEFGLHMDALVASTSKLLGYRRCGPNLDSILRLAIQQLVEHHTLQYDAEGFLKRGDASV